MEYFSIVNLLIWMFCTMLFAIIPVGLIQIMSTGIIKRKLLRQCLVIIYKIMEKIFFVVMTIPAVLLFADALRYLYVLIYFISFSASENYNLSSYITLSLTLIGVGPFVSLCWKIIRKKWYKDTREKAYHKWMGIGLFDRTTIMINKFPIKGIMHVVNLGLVILANTSKLINADLGLTTNIIYMSIATYYAFDKVWEYFLKKYSVFWGKLDNIIFDTKNIEAEKMPIFEKVSKARKELLGYYIDTGKYEVKEDDKSKFDFTI